MVWAIGLLLLDLATGDFDVVSLTTWTFTRTNADLMQSSVLTQA